MQKIQTLALPNSLLDKFFIFLKSRQDAEVLNTFFLVLTTQKKYFQRLYFSK